jgi:hypothetical protein
MLAVRSPENVLLKPPNIPDAELTCLLPEHNSDRPRRSWHKELPERNRSTSENILNSRAQSNQDTEAKLQD